MRINNTREIAQASPTILIYGPSKAGKTYILNTVPEPERSLVISAEAGLLTIAGEKGPGLDYIEISSIDELRKIVVWLQSSEEAQKYSFLALDSISEIAEICLAEEKENERDPRKAYGNMANTVMGIVRGFKHMPKTVYLSCRQDMIADAGSNMYYQIGMPGKAVIGLLPYVLDEVYAMVVSQDENGELRRWVQTQNDGVHISCGTRGNALERFEKPCFTHILNKMNTEITTAAKAA